LQQLSGRTEGKFSNFPALIAFNNVAIQVLNNGKTQTYDITVY